MNFTTSGFTLVQLSAEEDALISEVDYSTMQEDRNKPQLLQYYRALESAGKINVKTGVWGLSIFLINLTYILSCHIYSNISAPDQWRVIRSRNKRSSATFLNYRCAHPSDRRLEGTRPRQRRTYEYCTRGPCITGRVLIKRITHAGKYTSLPAAAPVCATESQ